MLQLNAFAPELRAAVRETVCDIASQCDAVRCDMAMLMLNAFFTRTWGERAGVAPRLDYWQELIPAVKSRYPAFRFLAEAYWDLEWELQQQGFAYCYDKRLYDRLEHDDAESVRLHLCADLAYQARLVRFLENHDEPRAAATFPPERTRALAVTTLTLPGAKLVHEGQLEGRKVRVPVFLGRRPDEPVDEALRELYRSVLRATAGEVFRNGEWRLCERSGWADNDSDMNIVAWCWKQGELRYLIAVNLSGVQSQGKVRVPWSELAGSTWRLEDVLSADRFERNGDEACGPGLYVDLAPWGCHFLELRRA